MDKELTFTLKLVSADEVNEKGRDSGLPVQAVSLTDGPANTIWLSWPPSTEYGYRPREIEQALGYEILQNLLHLGMDDLGR